MQQQALASRHVKQQRFTAPQEPRQCCGPAPSQLQHQAQREPQERPGEGSGAAGPERLSAPHVEKQPAPLPPNVPPPPPPPPEAQQQRGQEALPPAEHAERAQHNAAFWATLRKVKTRVGSRQQTESAQQQDAASREQHVQQQAGTQQAGQQQQQQQLLLQHATTGQPAPLLETERPVAVQTEGQRQAHEQTAAEQEAPQQMATQEAAAVQAKQQASVPQTKAPREQEEALARLQLALLAQLERHQAGQAPAAQAQGGGLPAPPQAHPQPAPQQEPGVPGRQAGPPACPVFSLLVFGLDGRMTGRQLEAYFRARNPATASAEAAPSGEGPGAACVCFSRLAWAAGGGRGPLPAC